VDGEPRSLSPFRQKATPNLTGSGSEEDIVARTALPSAACHYIVLAREHVQPDPAQFDQQLAAPLRALLGRGQAAGEIRTDLSAAWLMEALLGLVAGGLLSGDTLGAEETVAVVSSLFLEGAHARPPGT
jgi:hypothetical protein